MNINSLKINLKLDLPPPCVLSDDDPCLLLTDDEDVMMTGWCRVVNHPETGDMA